MIERLIEIAKDNRPAARRALSLGIIELCNVQGAQMEPHDREVAGQIIIRLIGEFEIELRAQISAQLAASAHAPKALVRALAEDEITIAGPVIAQSPLLDDDDLLDIIVHKSREHRLLIAARPNISAEVGDALLKPGEQEVLEALFNNQTAEISEAAMEYAVEESRSWLKLQHLIVARADLPPAIAARMASFVSDQLKRQLAAKFPHDQQIISQAMQEIGRNRPAIPNSTEQGVSARAAKLIDRLQGNGELNITRVISFLREKRLPLFFAGMAALTKLSTQSLIHFAFESDAGLAVLCRAAGADRGQFVAVALLLEQARRGVALPPNKLQTLSRLFDTLSEQRALEVIKDWRAGLHDPERKQAAG